MIEFLSQEICAAQPGDATFTLSDSRVRTFLTVNMGNGMVHQFVQKPKLYYQCVECGRQKRKDESDTTKKNEKVSSV